MNILTLTRHAVGILIAIIISNMVTLSLYYAGFPVIALALSIPVGLLIGMTIGYFWKPASNPRKGLK